ncbi:hypothetical protein M9H77_21314 [Catharanthus roseus]|uniref:Uncharacterized protein n=1 Tax=Catharanthus roseus TaxID=4058 RepID=A0ACC0AMP7_CATRO|nr:hypothetical protein M9H77_21314 [Catharanthus roseus]
MFWGQIMKYWDNPKYKAFCERNKRSMNEGWGSGCRESLRWFYLLHRVDVEKAAFREVPLPKFHELRQKTEEEAATMGAMPDELQLMANIAEGLKHGQLYGASSVAAHLLAESGQGQLYPPTIRMRSRGS